MEEKKSVLPNGWQKYALGALAGAAITVWVGFDALGWKMNSTAQQLAQRQGEASVASAYAAICKEQFSKAPDAAGRLATLEKAERYSRGDIITKGGFATMVGQKEPKSNVAQECADLLVPTKG